MENDVNLVNVLYNINLILVYYNTLTTIKAQYSTFWLLDPDKPQEEKNHTSEKNYSTKDTGKVEIVSALYTQNNFEK